MIGARQILRLDFESSIVLNILLMFIVLNNANLHEKNGSSIQRFFARNCHTTLYK